MSGASQIPEIVKSALEQNKFPLPANLENINYPIKLAELANIISSNSSKQISVADIEIDTLKKTAQKNSHKIDLTAKEVELIIFLHSAPSPISKEQILEKVWGYSADTNTRTVETHLHRLNSKFQEAFDIKIIISDKSQYKLLAD